MVFFSSGPQCWYFSHEPSSLFHHSVLVDLSVSILKAKSKFTLFMYLPFGVLVSGI